MECHLIMMEQRCILLAIHGDDVNEYSLSTAYDISSTSYVQSFYAGGYDNAPREITFNNDGSKMYILGNQGKDVNEFILSTAFDVSTASYVQRFSVQSQENTPNGIAFNRDGTKMFIVGNTGDDVNEYTLSTAFDVSTASYVH